MAREDFPNHNYAVVFGSGKSTTIDQVTSVIPLGGSAYLTDLIIKQDRGSDWHLSVKDINPYSLSSSSYKELSISLGTELEDFEYEIWNKIYNHSINLPKHFRFIRQIKSKENLIAALSKSNDRGIVTHLVHKVNYKKCDNVKQIKSDNNVSIIFENMQLDAVEDYVNIDEFYITFRANKTALDNKKIDRVERLKESKYGIFEIQRKSKLKKKVIAI